MKNQLLIFIILLLIPVSISAQYFGRNKVQYEKFNFQVLNTEHFKIHYYPEIKEVSYDAGIMLERWNDRLKKIFLTDVQTDQPIILYANHADFQQTNVIGGMIPQGTGGVTEGLRNRIILPFTGVYEENNHVLGHELVHAFQYDVFRTTKAGIAASQQMPLWFIEGLAEYLSIGRQSPHTAMWMRDAVLNDDVPEIKEVSRNYKYFPYRYGHSIWAFIGSRYGDENVGRLFRAVADNGWDEGWTMVLGQKDDSISVLWQNEIRETYAPQLIGKQKPEETGKRIISGKDGIALAPEVSPDGKFIVLYTAEDVFTLNLYLADAHTGKLLKELVSSNTDRHFDALRFFNSAGSWSPNGKNFAFIVIEDGDDEIAVLDVNSRSIDKQLKIPGVPAISHISWSPDGTNLLISGSSGGKSDLYLYNLNTNKTTQLTDDKYAELQPSWSPDGKRIAFATDNNPQSDFDNFKFGSMKIAVMDLQTKERQLISIHDESKHINPLFSYSGNSLYFIAAPDGFSNIYRYSFDTEEFFKVSNAATGISGLTELSPAMSLSKNTGRIVFSVFNNTNYDINTLGIDELQGEPVNISEDLYLQAVALPIREFSGQGIVSDYLNKPEEGLITVQNFTTAGYSPSLELFYIGQPQIGVTVNRFGAGLGGGVTMIFGDLLGDHMLGGVLQVSGTYKDIGGQVVYQNRKGRFNWGAAAGHIPYLTGYVRGAITTVTIGGQNYQAIEQTFVKQRVFNDHLMLLGEYPLSTNRRFEFGAGYTRISYSLEEEKIIIVGNTIVERTERDLDAPPALNLIQSSAAYVGDYSFFGFTSPVEGSRFRFEVEPTFGSLQFGSLLGDYRRYFFLNPVTFAFRALHYGRYFGDSEDSRLSPLHIGYNDLVRGYDLNSFEISECTHSGAGGCPEIDRLIGSKIGLFNFEVRLPLFGTEQFGIINFGFLPLELSAFFDAGVAWTKASRPVFEFESSSDKRIPVYSTGIAARVNLLGYLVVQAFYAHAFQRPGNSSQFGFIISPGW